MESKESSFFYIFHVPIEKVYNVFVSPTLVTCTFFQNFKIVGMKRNTNLDDAGNEVKLLMNGEHEFIFRIDSVVNMPYFKTFRHRSISNPSTFLSFDHTFTFFWNSTDKVTVFKFTAFSKDLAKNKNSLSLYIMEHKDSMCLLTENYLITTLTNLEESESISIGRSIEEVWDFVSDPLNQKFFNLNSANVTVTKLSEDIIAIYDAETKNRTVFRICLDNTKNEKKTFQMELINANVPLPKQKLFINLVRMDDKQCFVIFKHVILEFIPFDILMSYSSQKKKILRNVKGIIEAMKL